MIHSKVYFGSTSTPTFAFDDKNILEASCVLSVDLTGSELAQDEMDITVLWDKIGANVEVFAPADFDALKTVDGFYLATNYTGTSDLTAVPYGTPVWFYFNDALLGKFFFKKATRTNRNQYRVTIVSAVGLLGNLIDKGGIFKAINGDTFITVLRKIIGGSVGAKTNGMYPITGGVFDCLVEEQAAAQIIEGWLPYATKRENLHQLLFAESISLTKATDGTPLFSFILDNPTPTALDDSKIYINGNVNYQDAATAVEVTEHTFLDLGTNDELVTLFDGAASGSASNALITFSEPIHGDANGDLIATNVTVHEWGANYARITGSGTLQGYKYTHSKQTVRREIVNPPGAGNEYAITNVTLISPLNSGNVADRLLAYYSASNTVDMDIVRDGENPQVGRQYSFTDPFGDPKTGFVTRMDLTPSAIMKARCHIVTDYTPQGQGTNYKNAVLKTNTGTWIVPAGVTAARFILIGGGHGGEPGENGQNGGAITENGWTYDLSTGVGGAGGAGGAGGSGGKVKTVELSNLTPGDTASITCGEGGASGTNGNPTLLIIDGVTYSTEDGDASVPPNGVVNLFTGDVYAISGNAGAAGANGGKCGDENFKGGEKGADFNETYKGGLGGIFFDHYNYVSTEDSYIMSGGGGGGAALGGNGGNGTPPVGTTGSYTADYGNGGKGGDATAPAAQTIPGSGGHGGNGGGGGGANGLYSYSVDVYPSGRMQMFNSGVVGQGGSGSAGSKGAKGCILIYY